MEITFGKFYTIIWVLTFIGVGAYSFLVRPIWSPLAIYIGLFLIGLAVTWDRIQFDRAITLGNIGGGFRAISPSPQGIIESPSIQQRQGTPAMPFYNQPMPQPQMPQPMPAQQMPPQISDTENKLAQYLLDGYRKGYNIIVVRNHLIQAGYSASMLDEIINKVFVVEKKKTDQVAATQAEPEPEAEEETPEEVPDLSSTLVEEEEAEPPKKILKSKKK